MANIAQRKIHQTNTEDHAISSYQGKNKNLKTNTFLKTYHLYQSFFFLWTLFNVVNNEPKKYHVLQIHRICFADHICPLLNWIRINHQTMPLKWWQTSSGCNKCATEKGKKVLPALLLWLKCTLKRLIYSEL